MLHRKAVVDEVLAVAAEIGVPPGRVAMAWLRHRAARSATALVPIIGPRTLAQLDDYLAALDVQLTDAQADRITGVSAPPLGVPHEVTAGVRARILGGDPALVVPPAVPVA